MIGVDVDSINVNKVSFRWSGGQLLITTTHGQDLLSATSAVQLLDFLLVHQQEIYAGEQGRKLPTWAREERRYVPGSIEQQAPRLEE
jgi:hypothetical protein